MNVRHTNTSCGRGARVHAQGVVFYVLYFVQSRQVLAVPFLSLQTFLVLFFKIVCLPPENVLKVINHHTGLQYPLEHRFPNLSSMYLLYLLLLITRERVLPFTVCLQKWLTPDLWLICSQDNGSRECHSWWASQARTWDDQRPISVLKGP